jgi:hypothetical protein
MLSTLSTHCVNRVMVPVLSTNQIIKQSHVSVRLDVQWRLPVLHKYDMVSDEDYGLNILFGEVILHENTVNMEFKPPANMCLQGNVADNWKLWEQQFKNFMTAKEADGKNDDVKIAMLLTCIGPDALERYNQFQFAEGEDRGSYDLVLEKFNTHFSGLKRTVFSRYQFWTHKRGEAQPFDNFLTQLQTLCKNCEFTERDNMIRDKIVFTVKEKPLKERLLREENLTLTKTQDLCRAFEITQNEIRSMAVGGAEAAESKSVHAYRNHGNSKQHNYNRSSKPSSAEPSKPAYNSKQSKDSMRKCGRCGYKHGKKQCPAYGQKCNKCNGPNHFATMCKSKAIHATSVPDDEYASSDEFWLGSIVKCLSVETTPRTSAWYTTVNVCNSKIKMKIDTGAEVDTIPARTWRKIKGKPEIARSATILRGYTDAILELEGRAEVPFRVGDQTITSDVYITKGKTVPILGLESSTRLGLVKPGENGEHVEIDSVQIKDVPLSVKLDTPPDEYTDVYTGLGRYPGEYHIKLKEGAEPVIHAPRRIAPAIMDKLKQKLSEMEDIGVILSVDEPTEWVNSLVITEKKDGSLRLCLDPKDLNKNIQREHFQIPTFEDVVTRLGGKKVFSILDQKDSYWQVVLDEESSKLCTFNTPFGRYRFKRMPFGISSASEILQKRTYKAFGDIPGVHVISDDMLIAADTDVEHDGILSKVMERARSQGVKFNKQKTQFKLPEVFYMGRRVGADGIRPDEAKIKAIVDMPDPTDKAGVQRLIGMLNFLSPFIPNMSTITAPLRNLLKATVPWQWMPEHSDAMLKIKAVL